MLRKKKDLEYVTMFVQRDARPFIKVNITNITRSANMNDILWDFLKL